jgi:hypothetical protein
MEPGVPQLGQSRLGSTWCLLDFDDADRLNNFILLNTSLVGLSLKNY